MLYNGSIPNGIFIVIITKLYWYNKLLNRYK